MNLSRERQRPALCAALFVWCCALIMLRVSKNPSALYTFLLWNLFLAALPLVFGAAFRAASGRKSVLQIVWFILWLLFFPNAPYILTDLLHLKDHTAAQVWLDLAVLMSCAGTGAVFGYYSLADVHAAIEERFGKSIGWTLACFVLLLCGYGIYVGRFLRFNSWNALLHPTHLIKTLFNNWQNPDPFPNPLTVTLVFAIGLLLGYCSLRAMNEK
ncbi:MAG TPA: DUF1361 domain-containing protein [Abditibacteriaceae bacterium]|jgi:uncharacterized membrane protein